LGQKLNRLKKSSEVLVVVSKEIREEVNADKTKYTVMSRDQNVGQNHNININNRFSGRAEEFK